MSAFINTQSMEWPIHQGDIDAQFGGQIPDYVKPLIYVPREGAQQGQTYEINEPKNVDDQWFVTWTIRDKTKEELENERKIEETLWQRLKG